MRGHFKKRGASWYFWVELEPGPDGKRRQKSRGGFKTRKEAEHAFAALRDEIRLGSYVEPSKLTLNRFLEEEWLPAIRASVRPSTLRFYAQNVASYIKPTIGRTLLPNVTAAKLNAFYANLARERTHRWARPIRRKPLSEDRAARSHLAAQGTQRRGALGSSRAQSCEPRGGASRPNARDARLDRGTAPSIPAARSSASGSTRRGCSSSRPGCDEVRCSGSPGRTLTYAGAASPWCAASLLSTTSTSKCSSRRLPRAGARRARPRDVDALHDPWERAALSAAPCRTHRHCARRLRTSRSDRHRTDRPRRA